MSLALEYNYSYHGFYSKINEDNTNNLLLLVPWHTRERVPIGFISIIIFILEYKKMDRCVP